MKKIIYYLLTMLTYTLALSQVKGQAVALKGATIHVGNGKVLKNAIITFEKSLITQVTDKAIDLQAYRVTDVSGKHIYPGFILPDTYVGLAEIGAVRATLDFNEVGRYNPNVRALIAYNTDSELIPTFRFNGILTAQVAPQGGVISGTSAVMSMSGWNWEDATLKADDGIYINWPRRMLPPRWWLGETEPRVNENYETICQELDDIFAHAASYRLVASIEKNNTKLAAMEGLFEGITQLFIRVNKAKEIVKSILLAKKYGVKKIILVGGKESLKVKDFLKEHQIPVLLANTHRMPYYERSDLSLPFRLPYLLKEAGLMVGLVYSDGPMPSGRNLPFAAGTAAAYGLGKEEALQMITANNAKILGIDKQLGTLEKGKQATLFVSEGDALDMRTNRLIRLFIQGNEVKLDGKQQDLYKKYKDKYGK